jgi:glycogen synthase
MSENGSLKILLLAAEVVPFAKTGGLADVAGALPKAFRALGHDIRVAMPRYGRIDLDQFRLQAAIFLTFNTPLSRRIYASSDMFLMPSRFEPCGTSQLVAMNYGSVPIVRATGGLADTVQDYDPHTGQGTGFVFRSYDRWALFAAVVRAIEIFKHHDLWQQIQLRGMQVDFSWERSARQYVDLYQRAIASRLSRPDLKSYQVQA